MVYFVTSVTDGFYSQEAEPYIEKVRAYEHMLILSVESLDAIVKKLQKVVAAINAESRVKFTLMHQKQYGYGYIQLMQHSEVPGKKPLTVSYMQYSRVSSLVYAENNHIVKDVELYALPDSKVDDIKNQMLNLYSIEL